MEPALKKCMHSILCCINSSLLIIYSYALMLSCWSECPSDRPAFTEIANTVTKLIKPLAQYMEMCENHYDEPPIGSY